MGHQTPLWPMQCTNDPHTGFSHRPVWMKQAAIHIVATSLSLVSFSFPSVFCILPYCTLHHSLGRQWKELRHICIRRPRDEVVSQKVGITSIQVDLGEVVSPFFFPERRWTRFKCCKVCVVFKKEKSELFVKFLAEGWVDDLVRECLNS